MSAAEKRPMLGQLAEPPRSEYACGLCKRYVSSLRRDQYSHVPFPSLHNVLHIAHYMSMTLLVELNFSRSCILSFVIVEKEG